MASSHRFVQQRLDVHTQSQCLSICSGGDPVWLPTYPYTLHISSPSHPRGFTTGCPSFLPYLLHLTGSMPRLCFSPPRSLSHQAFDRSFRRKRVRQETLGTCWSRSTLSSPCPVDTTRQHSRRCISPRAGDKRERGTLKQTSNPSSSSKSDSTHRITSDSSHQ